jgi:hypothetical protein
MEVPFFVAISALRGHLNGLEITNSIIPGELWSQGSYATFSAICPLGLKAEVREA